MWHSEAVLARGLQTVHPDLQGPEAAVLEYVQEHGVAERVPGHVRETAAAAAVRRRHPRQHTPGALHHPLLLPRPLPGAFRRRQADKIEPVQETGAVPQLREAYAEGVGQEGHELLHLQRAGPHGGDAVEVGVQEELRAGHEDGADGGAEAEDHQRRRGHLRLELQHRRGDRGAEPPRADEQVQLQVRHLRVRGMDVQQGLRIQKGVQHHHAADALHHRGLDPLLFCKAEFS